MSHVAQQHIPNRGEIKREQPSDGSQRGLMPNKNALISLHTHNNPAHILTIASIVSAEEILCKGSSVLLRHWTHFKTENYRTEDLLFLLGMREILCLHCFKV